eukprot:TRINITY_DN12365_c0_g1_i1.p1 TRINITY_DN12365_c0_g1~~TRINITY_DN12365_c0_g1_i1.p1  ORF type:complete len:424 (+),score=97.34 TRINITY_DN12365_c0_g1_i1:83-1273(+)
MARRPPPGQLFRRSRRQPGRLALPLAVLGALGAVACCCSLWQRSGSKGSGGMHAWLGPVSRGTRAEAAASVEEASGAIGRRQLYGGLASVVGGSYLGLASAPEDAHAFRKDRIMNAKNQYVPKIRAAYQKLEGLRDDIYLFVKFVNGTELKVPSRPADWYNGIDKSLNGPLTMAVPDTKNNWGCEPWDKKIEGIALVSRGRCSFAQKVANAKAAGATSVVLYDELLSKAPLMGTGVGARRAKANIPRTAGESLMGGAAIVPYEKGVTIMAASQEEGKPAINGVMIKRSFGYDIMEELLAGREVNIVLTDRFEFKDGIDQYIKKDLPKLIREMELYSTIQRSSKDDMDDPIVSRLKTDRIAFEKAVKAKDYAKIRTSFSSWQEHMDEVAQWELTETE